MTLPELINEKEQLERFINKKDGDNQFYSDAMIAKWRVELASINTQILPLLTELSNNITMTPPEEI
jgi:hypothetical protein